MVVDEGQTGVIGVTIFAQNYLCAGADFREILNLAAAVEQVDLKVLLLHLGLALQEVSVFLWLSTKTNLILKEVFRDIILCYLCTGQQHSCNPNVSCFTSTKQGLCWTLVVHTAEFYCHIFATKPMIPLTFPRFCLAVLICS